jgi:pimeloyl-ACP methyl ester carboxylesterase
VSEMKHLDLHGDRVAYRDAGAGEALLLIHGMAGSSATWRAVLPQLSKKYRVVAPDLFGHGESAKPRGDYSLGAFAAWLRDLLDEPSPGRQWSVSRLVAVWPCSSPISIATTANGWLSSAAVAWAPT